MNKLIALFAIILLPAIAFSQQKYPFEVLPGQEKVVTSTTDTLWVLKHSQLQRAIQFGKENKLLKEEIEILKKKIGTQGQITTECDSLVKIHQADALKYKQDWLEADEDLQTVAKKYKQQKLLKNLGFIGMAVTFVLGAYLL